jgi:hypothetical protein
VTAKSVSSRANVPRTNCVRAGRPSGLLFEDESAAGFASLEEEETEQAARIIVNSKVNIKIFFIKWFLL